MQAQGPILSHLNLAALQQPAENLDLDEDRDTDFDTRNSLTGDDEKDQMLLGIIIALVQLLLKQQGEGGQQQGEQDDTQGESNTDGANGTNGTNGSSSDLTSKFNDRDKNLLLSSIGTSPASGVSINRISDSNASGNLNDGDNLELQSANNGTQNHTITGSEVSDFINARNPSGTPTLSLNTQQTSTLEGRYNLSDVKLSDVSGNGNIGLGDILSGSQTQNGTKVRVDIPVDQAMLNLLNIS